MTYSVKQAAEATGKTKPTILRAIQKGKISAKKDDHGEWEIDPAELHRVYPPVPENTDTGVSVEVELLRQMLADKNRQIESLNRRLESVDEERRTTLRQLTALLTDQRAQAIITPPPPAASPAETEDHPNRQSPPHASPPSSEVSWFRRMMGGK
jgi:excisionase family DNA binding protein